MGTYDAYWDMYEDRMEAERANSSEDKKKRIIAFLAKNNKGQYLTNSNSWSSNFQQANQFYTEKDAWNGLISYSRGLCTKDELIKKGFIVVRFGEF